jgi:pimeloyl-ACP methyl ester carboxylesterase
VRILLLIATTLCHAIACWWEDRTPPPGQRLDVGGYCLHAVSAGTGSPAIILDHSLGGIEGYLLLDRLAQLSQTCIYDRAGFGWSDRSPYPRSSDRIVSELDTLLIQTGIEPPYILVGDSFGSYNMRLYAHRYPDKVAGLVLTDGLHESALLKMPLALRGLQLFFASGFIMSVLGAALGFIRLLNWAGLFEVLKPELRNFPLNARRAVKRSFCRPQHWLTMTQEILNLDRSGRQVQVANDLDNLPIVSIKAASFFRPSLMTRFIPLNTANQLRDRIHNDLSNLSTDFLSLDAERSGHFVWVDRPDVMLRAVQILLDKYNTARSSL